MKKEKNNFSDEDSLLCHLLFDKISQKGLKGKFYLLLLLSGCFLALFAHLEKVTNTALDMTFVRYQTKSVLLLSKENLIRYRKGETYFVGEK